MLKNNNLNTNIDNPTMEIGNILIINCLEKADNLKFRLLTVLHEQYADELLENHRPGVLDFHKERHRIKIRLAKALQATCKKPTTSLEDAIELIKVVECSYQENQTIDPKFGRLGKDILNIFIKEVSNFKFEITEVEHIIKNFRDFNLNILNHLKALLAVSPDDSIYGYHMRSISESQKTLVIEYKKAIQMLGLLKNVMVEKIYAEKINFYVAEIKNWLNKLDENKYTPKMKQEFLNLQILPLLINDKVPDKEICTNANRNKLIIFKAIIDPFVGYLKFEEKEFLWKFHQKLAKNLDPFTYKHRLAQMNWLLNCVFEKNLDGPDITTLTFAEKAMIEDIKQKQQVSEDAENLLRGDLIPNKPNNTKKIDTPESIDFTDPLSTHILINKFKDIFDEIDNLNLSDLENFIDTTLQKHFDYYLNQMKFNVLYHDILNEWQKHIVNLFDDIKLKLNQAESLLDNNDIASERKINITSKLVKSVLSPTILQNVTQTDSINDEPRNLLRRSRS